MDIHPKQEHFILLAFLYVEQWETFQVNTTFSIQEFSYKTFILHIAPSTPVRKKYIMDEMSDWLNKLYFFPSFIHFLKLLFHRSFIINFVEFIFYVLHLDEHDFLTLTPILHMAILHPDLSLCPTYTYQAPFFLPWDSCYIFLLPRASQRPYFDSSPLKTLLFF